MQTLWKIPFFSVLLLSLINLSLQNPTISWAKLYAGNSSSPTFAVHTNDNTASTYFLLAKEWIYYDKGNYKKTQSKNLEQLNKIRDEQLPILTLTKHSSKGVLLFKTTFTVPIETVSELAIRSDSVDEFIYLTYSYGGGCGIEKRDASNAQLLWQKMQPVDSCVKFVLDDTGTFMYSVQHDNGNYNLVKIRTSDGETQARMDGINSFFARLEDTTMVYSVVKKVIYDITDNALIIAGHIQDVSTFYDFVARFDITGSDDKLVERKWIFYMDDSVFPTGGQLCKLFLAQVIRYHHTYLVIALPSCADRQVSAPKLMRWYLLHHQNGILERNITSPDYIYYVDTVRERELPVTVDKMGYVYIPSQYPSPCFGELYIKYNSRAMQISNITLPGCTPMESVSSGGSLTTYLHATSHGLMVAGVLSGIDKIDFGPDTYDISALPSTPSDWADKFTSHFVFFTTVTLEGRSWFTYLMMGVGTLILAVGSACMIISGMAVILEILKRQQRHMYKTLYEDSQPEPFETISQSHL